MGMFGEQFRFSLHVEHKLMQSKERDQATSPQDSRLGHVNLGKGTLTNHILGHTEQLNDTTRPSVSYLATTSTQVSIPITPSLSNGRR